MPPDALDEPRRDPRRALPSVNALVDSDGVRALLATAPRGLVVAAVRDAIEAARGTPERAPSSDAAWSDAVADALARRARPSLRRVHNATGVVLHTNLGRAPLAAAAIDAVREIADGFSNLEYDLDEGARGSRHVHCAAILRELTGADAALVVNNCAAALVLTLATLAAGREVVVSRGELIEIGGSFRVPEIMAAAGVRLREVGTTNRTHLRDYERALGPDTAAIVKVHRSNFAISGFTAEATLAELAPLAETRGLPLLHDFGSGLLVPLDAWGLRGEPTVGDLVARGASLVLSSGDKLLGGPQAGIIVGRADLIALVARHPLARAFRVDKLTLAALEATLQLHRDPAVAVREVPALAMLTAPADDVRRRAESVRDSLASRGVAGDVVASEAGVGGGAFPTARIASFAVALAGDAVAAERALRAAPVPVIGRIADGRLLLDLRSVPARHDDALVAAVSGALAPR